MSCASCASRIEKKMVGLEGVKQAVVNFGVEQASIDYDSGKISSSKIRKVIRDLGFDVLTIRGSFFVEGMTDMSSVFHVEKILRSFKGVLGIEVKFATKSVLIDYIAHDFGARDFKNALSNHGFTLVIDKTSKDAGFDSKEQSQALEITYLLRRLIFSASIATIMVFSNENPMGNFFSGKEVVEHNFLLLILATPVQFWAGWMFYKGTWAGLRRGNLDMNTLITIGTSTAYFYSVFITLFPDTFLGIENEIYFNSSVMIISLVLMGRLLEAKAKANSSSAIRKLIELKTETALVVRENIEKVISIDELIEGEIVIVKPGEMIPADGVIIKGATSIDESMISGESIPVDKDVQDAVIGGSLNKTGFFKMRVTCLGRDSVLSQIIRLVEEAQGIKAPVQKLADKVSSFFVPIVIGLATLSFGYWWLFGSSVNLPSTPFIFALISFISVMIIACPCALGLATPSAIMVGVGKGAELGILIKGGDVFEQAGKLDTILFDKTGTLTEGLPEVNDVILDPNSELSVENLLMFAASLEKGSEHPLAKAVLSEAKKRNLTLQEISGFETLPGFGVKASIPQHEIILGNERLMRKYNIDIEHWAARLEEFGLQGKTPMILAVSGKIVGVITVSDKVRSYAKRTIDRLKNLGLEIGMITGDNHHTALSIANQLGIHKVFSEVLPEDKASEVEKLQKKGHLVSMVGDGINDAPALSRADLGIALGSGTDVAIEASDITLLTNDLRSVADAIELSHKTMVKIKQNLFFAFFYNCLGIPIAAGILYPFFGISLKPMYAALAMSLSSVSVITNALLLKKVNLR